MNIKFLATVIGCCCAAPVLAQSGVQIYGIADAGIMKVKGESAKVVSGLAEGSRIGFKGTEDIGGGYKAIFQLEARVELDTGSQVPTLISDNQGLYLTRGMGAIPLPFLNALRLAIQPKGGPSLNPERALFDRTAMVGIVTPVGAILLGRMYTPGYEVFAAADVFETGTAGTWGSIVGGTAGFTSVGADIRSQKSIQYRIATPAGIGGSLMWGGERSGYLGRYKRFLGAAVTYKANGFDIGLGHNRGKDQFGRDSLITTTAGGSYRWNDFKFFAGYHAHRNRNSALLVDYLAGFNAGIVPAMRAAGLTAPQIAGLTNVFTTNIIANTQIDARSYQVGGHYKLGNGRLMASVAHQNDRTASNSDATLMAIGYDYNLSKRTDVYTVLANIKNQNDGQYTPSASGTPGGFTAVPGDDSRAVQIGIRHRF